MTRPDVVIVAGAGAGKTHALVEDYLETVLGIGATAAADGSATILSPDRVLAVTFTEKAAHEMRARVLSRLARLRAGDAEDPLSARLHVPAAVLDRVRRAVATAPILTFHALCARLIRDHAAVLGLDPRFSILEPLDEDRLLKETAEAVVIDAARTGDPRVAELLARVGLRGFGDRLGLVECLVRVHGTLAERGLDAAAVPLADADGPALITARAAALQAVRTALVGVAGHARAAQAAAALDVVAVALDPATPGDTEPLLALAFSGLRSAAGSNWGGPKLADARRALVAAIDQLGVALVDAQLTGLSVAVRSLVAELDARVRLEKDARGVLGFGDLLLRARDLLQEHAGVRARVVRRISRVLVDELQDTSPVQEQILALLADPAREDGASVLMVGDPRQSIYAFRGADPRVLDRALARPRAQRRDLAECRRSTTPIVALANQIAAHALGRGVDGVPADQRVPMSALRAAQGPAGAHWICGAGNDTLPPHERESLVVAGELSRLFANTAFRPSDVAILVRRQKAAGPLARALGRAGIRADVIGGDGFWDRPEVADLAGALHLALDPEDELAVLACLRSPFLCATDDAVLALYEALPDRGRRLTWSRALTAAADALVPRDLLGRMQGLDALLGAVRAEVFAGRSARALDLLLDVGGYAAATAIEPDGALRARNIDKLRTLVDARGDDAWVGLARLAELLDERPREAVASARLDGGDDRGAVQIMTVHQAKGLEFPVVVLADAGSGLKGETDDICFDAEAGLSVTARARPIAGCAPRPGARAGGAAPLTAIQRVRRRLRDRSEAELARLLYVAVTRARDAVYVVGLPRRNGPGSLLGALELARTADAAAFDALLPRVTVEPVLADAPQAPVLPARDEAAAAQAADLADAQRMATLAPVPPLPLGRLLVRAGELVDAGARQPALFPTQAAPATGDDEDERLPPRAAGRLAHALVGLIATEERASLSDAAALDAAIARAARALGVRAGGERDRDDGELPRALAEGVARTLAGPVQALLARGASLAFEERLRLVRDGVAVEGRADLVARLPDRTIAVELKKSAERARTAELQVAAYAAALAETEPVPVFVARWQLGDLTPAAEAPLSSALLTRLQAALTAARSLDGRARARGADTLQGST